MNIDSLEVKACSDLMTEYREVTVPTQDYIKNTDSLEVKACSDHMTASHSEYREVTVPIQNYIMNTHPLKIWEPNYIPTQVCLH